MGDRSWLSPSRVSCAPLGLGNRIVRPRSPRAPPGLSDFAALRLRNRRFCEASLNIDMGLWTLNLGQSERRRDMNAVTIPISAAQEPETKTTRKAWKPGAKDELIYRWVKFEGKRQTWVASALGISPADRVAGDRAL